MFQFRRFPTNCYLIHKGLIEYCSIGFPHSEIHGSRTAFVFPWLIVDRYVLRRLPMPRHSPCALISLTFSELCVLSVFVNFLNVFVVNITLNSFRLDFSRIFWLHYLVVSISHYLYSVFKVHFYHKAFLLYVVGPSGLEPPTSRLSGVRSNHLSYEPISMWFCRLLSFRTLFYLGP